MFSNLRQGSQLYILHKCASTPFIEMGSVESTSNVMMGYYPSLPNMPINISVRVGDKTTPYQGLPANAEVADVTNNATGETITIACTKEALNAEVQAMRQKSIDTINSVEYHKQRVGVCDMLLQQLNPEQAEKAQREKEMSEMRVQMAQMAQTIAQLNARLGGEGASSLPDGDASGTVVIKKKGEMK